MYDNHSTLLRSLHILFGSLVLIAIVAVVSLILFSPKPTTAKAEGIGFAENSSIMSVSDSPNIVTRGMARTFFGLSASAKSLNRTMSSTAKTVSSITVQYSKNTGRAIKSGAIATVHGIGSGLLFTGRIIGNSLLSTGRTIGSSIAFVIRIPGNVIKGIASIPLINSFMRPADHVSVPIIDPNSPELKAALIALPAKPVEEASTIGNVGPAWPIHGAITTYFGVSHWPYQKTHTGLDISDGQAPGITPIKPFRPGRVIEKVISNSGLGNHVILDHGNGVTSVYAHLSSINVNVGDVPNMDSVLGFEGSTGASTGTHLHFEIRVNGQAADPRQFITGNP